MIWSRRDIDTVLPPLDLICVRDFTHSQFWRLADTWIERKLSQIASHCVLLKLAPWGNGFLFIHKLIILSPKESFITFGGTHEGWSHYSLLRSSQRRYRTFFNRNVRRAKEKGSWDNTSQHRQEEFCRPCDIFDHWNAFQVAEGLWRIPLFNTPGSHLCT